MSERTYTVAVAHKSGKPVAYPPRVGADALRLMEEMARRGLQTEARTHANGITAFLTLDEMRSVVI
jgi:hypothetical protein